MSTNTGGEDESRLDVNSENFDPLLALYSDSVTVPHPEAVVLDNVPKFEFLFSRQSLENPVRVDELLKNQPRPKKEPQPSTSEVERRTFPTKEEEPHRSRAGRREKPARNVLTRIASASGPLAFLRDCMEKRIRVKVWTRNAAGIRGFCLGFVVAFDKHWNLALCDVTEVWSRRCKRKKIPAGPEMEPPTAWRAMGRPVVTPPKTIVLKTEKGVETCERHVNQMLMRGEHVAFISVPTA